MVLFDQGRQRILTPAHARTAGYVLLDLSDDWVPMAFRDDLQAGQPPNSLRAHWVAMANDREDAFGARVKKGDHNYLEFYGIPPSLSALRARWIEEEARRPCFAQVNMDALKRLDRSLHYQSGRAQATRVLREARGWQRELRLLRARVRRGETISTGQRRRTERAAQLASTHLQALAAAQKRLRCEGLISPNRPLRPNRFDWNLHLALQRFERKHRIFGWGQIWGKTRAALARDLAENNQRALVRILAERLANQLGILEDGSVPSSMQNGTLGGARDRLHSLTQAAATALGVSTPAGARRFLVDHPASWFTHRIVALRLPEPPRTHRPHMDLSVVIDRGDVWYDFPYDASGRPRAQPIERRPHLTLYVRYQGRQVPLVRWPTTIGGWRTEVHHGCAYWKYKASDVGDRVWKFLVAGPVWIPPRGTPPRDLVGVRTRRGLDHLVAKQWIIGPGPLSAYGLVAALHTREVTRRGRIVDEDSSIRTHGSTDYMSILTSHSHGCHRLYNHLAIRLSSFLLRHRRHVALGERPCKWRQDVTYRGKRFHFQRQERGYYFRFDPPIPVKVRGGRIRGNAHQPLRQLVLKPGTQPASCVGSSRGAERTQTARPAMAGQGALPRAEPTPLTP